MTDVIKMFMVNAAEICSEIVRLSRDGFQIIQVVQVSPHKDDSLSNDWRTNYLILYSDGEE